MKPFIVDYNDLEFPADGRTTLVRRLRSLPREGDPQFNWRWPDDECEAVSLNYTSGTTGNPKGVVCRHRGAALIAIPPLSRPMMRAILPISGLCRCTTAMAGAFRGL